MKIEVLKDITGIEEDKALFDDTDDPVIVNHAHILTVGYHDLLAKCD